MARKTNSVMIKLGKIRTRKDKREKRERNKKFKDSLVQSSLDNFIVKDELMIDHVDEIEIEQNKTLFQNYTFNLNREGYVSFLLRKFHDCFFPNSRVASVAYGIVCSGDVKRLTLFMKDYLNDEQQHSKFIDILKEFEELPENDKFLSAKIYYQMMSKAYDGYIEYIMS